MATYPPPPPIGNKNRNKKAPQEVLSEFWDKYHTKKPGKVTSIFPRSLYKDILPPLHPRGARSSRNAAESYEAAAKECRDRVKRIVRECHRTNAKFTDPDFDIERDNFSNCLNGLVRDYDSGVYGDAGDTSAAVNAWEVKNSLQTLAASQMLGANGTLTADANALSRFVGADDVPFPFGSGGVSSGEMYNPGSVHRLDWIFESPRFTVGGFSSSDIKQGANGDCWWLAAVATIAHRKDLMERVCVARDEECGVYGFVFQRDGEWISTVVDDNLYLSSEDFDYYGDVYDSTGKRARRHRKENQTGSEALYFARCDDENETWLPLLEKAFAKVHGDYESISGGWPGEAVEDMTGGVTTTVATNRVLGKDKLWKELQSSGDGDFVFALAAMGTGWDRQKSGLALGHAYSVLEAREVVDEDGNKFRLVKVRNPWGQRASNGLGEWNGPWSDGSREWTPYWLKKMDHKFGDDGVFWMSYKDMLDTFMFLHRTRLFDDRWTVVQQWTSANVSWITGYLQSKFEIEVAKSGLIIIVLTQLDERYFTGLEGEYRYSLHFILQAAPSEGSSTTADHEHICRVRPIHDWENRSVSCEVELDPGKYFVLPKITATRKDGAKPVEEVVKQYADANPQKLRQIGMQYDLAHARGGVPDEDDLLVQKKELAKKKKDAKKRKLKNKNRKVLNQAAKAMEKVAVAIQEATKDDDPKGKKDEASAGDEKKGETGAKASDPAATASAPSSDPAPALAGSAPGSTSTLTPTTGSAPTDQTKSAAPATATTTPSQAPPKDAPPPVEKDAAETKTEEASSSSESSATNPTPNTVTEAEVETEAKSDVAVAGDAAAAEVPPAVTDAPAVVEDAESEDSESDSDDESVAAVDDEDTPAAPWNAVVVMGLRVYARDAGVTVKLVKPDGPGEANALTVEGQPAGATM